MVKQTLCHALDGSPCVIPTTWQSDGAREDRGPVDPMRPLLSPPVNSLHTHKPRASYLENTSPRRETRMERASTPLNLAKPTCDPPPPLCP